jgi:hypothetical protein
MTLMRERGCCSQTKVVQIEVMVVRATLQLSSTGTRSQRGEICLSGRCEIAR